jgi:hypothetical protein
MSSLAQTREIVLTVPRSALGGVDLQNARYGVAMFGNAEGGEGNGNVRPDYDLADWQNPGPDFWWITEYRFGGGAGVWTDAPNHDSDTRDPNALDVIVRDGQTQAQVLNWQAAFPTKVPMQGLTLPPDTTAPTVTAAFSPTEPADGIYRTAVTATLTGQDDRPGVLVEYRINGGEWKAYSAPVTIAPDGVHVFEYRATDAAGNRSAVGSKTLTIDKPSEVPGGPIGTVPPTLSLTLGAPATFGAFQPGVPGTYTASTIATVISTADDATLTVLDPSADRTGRLINGSYALNQPLEARAGTGPVAPISGTPLELLRFEDPVGATPVTLGFRQSIAATVGLRTGSYGKTLTFTLSTTTP